MSGKTQVSRLHKGKAPGQLFSNDLAHEAFDMEKKLLELKKAMEREREKRESLGISSPHSSIWRNGGSGRLRSHRKNNDKAPAPTKTPEKASATPSSVSTPAKQPPAEASQPQFVVNASSVNATRTPSATSATAQSRVQRLVVEHEVDDGGIGCGTESGPTESLLDGKFDERGGHASFLDALNEWRRATKGEEPSESAPSTSNDKPRESKRIEPVQPGLEMQIQTAPAAPHRPQSARHITSCFDKLFWDVASKQAGICSSRASDSSFPDLPSSQTNRPSSAAHRPSPPSPRRTSTSAPSGDSKAGPPSAAATAAAAAAGDVDAQLLLLDRLAELEDELEAKGAHKDAEEQALLTARGKGGSSSIQVSTVKGMVGLTAKTRLPDSIQLPGDEEEEE